MGAVEFGAYIRNERLARSLTQDEFGGAVGISHAYVSKIERGVADDIGYDVLESLAGVLGRPLQELRALLRDEPPPAPLAARQPSREIPVVSDLSAGAVGGAPVDSWEPVTLSEYEGRLLLAGKAVGGCMEPLIHAGDVVIFDAANKTPRDGQLVVATIPDPGYERGRGVVKRFYRLGRKVKLDPLVGDPIILAVEDVRIEGVVTEVRKKF